MVKQAQKVRENLDENSYRDREYVGEYKGNETVDNEPPQAWQNDVFEILAVNIDFDDHTAKAFMDIAFPKLVDLYNDGAEPSEAAYAILDDANVWEEANKQEFSEILDNEDEDFEDEDFEF